MALNDANAPTSRWRSTAILVALREANIHQWRDAFLGYFTTGGANNGGTESINGLIELARRVARGFRDPDNYRLRMLLIGGGLRL